MDPLLIIIGPTAVGKTDFALTLAKEIKGEIISADSMQIYRKMNIGTAKPSPEEMAAVPHHLVDELSPDQEFTVADYQERVEKLVPTICKRGAVPILVGGTGLYVQAVTEGFCFPEMETDWAFRDEMHQLAEKQGPEAVHAILCEVDPELAARLHPNDLRRVIRGIEVYRQTGKTSTYFQRQAQMAPRRYDTIKVGLIRDRAELYERIDLRVDQMIQMGLVDEVKGLLEEGYSRELISMQGLGYKEIVGYLQGEYDLEEAVYRLKRDTRHFAKRQLTWFKRDSEIIWLNPERQTVREMVDFVKERIHAQWS